MPDFLPPNTLLPPSAFGSDLNAQMAPYMTTQDQAMSAAMSPNSAQSAMNASQEQLTPSTSNLSFPPEAIKYGTMFKFVAYKYDLQQTNAKLIDTISGAQIFLPLPAQISVSQGIDYEGMNAGALGMAVKAGNAGVKSVQDMFSKGATSASVSSMETGLSDGLVVGTEYALRRFADTVASGAGSQIDQILGNVVNPYNVATFKNSQSRSHQLDFMLIPRTAAESVIIKHICDTFIWHSLPATTAGLQGATVNGQSMFLNMPDEVEISFYGSTALYTFARAVITNVTIDYAPFGEPSFFLDDAPTAVHLSLAIQEIQQLTQSSYSAAAASSFSDSTAATSDTNGIVSNDAPQIIGGNPHL